MSETTDDIETCRRCGHSPRQRATGVSQMARRAIGRKARRVECGEQTSLGWACPCRSHFHAS
ncbi:hypothetical protein [Nocardioides sp. URHA0020]|uniref:hypothetical protein n=1 Tax=Nocardioides sp. URHA0020 TaxID=1380392 RepID=UPI0012DC4198|nr:hypothetical protein [Nocardioides sp. URHA0020]